MCADGNIRNNGEVTLSSSDSNIKGVINSFNHGIPYDIVFTCRESFSLPMVSFIACQGFPLQGF